MEDQKVRFLVNKKDITDVDIILSKDRKEIVHIVKLDLSKIISILEEDFNKKVINKD